MMEKIVYDDPMGEYMEYLKRYVRNSLMSLWQVHQLLISRLVAQTYGLTVDEIKFLDEKL